jgi:hypothetical protein
MSGDRLLVEPGLGGGLRSSLAEPGSAAKGISIVVATFFLSTLIFF